MLDFRTLKPMSIQSNSLSVSLCLSHNAISPFSFLFSSLVIIFVPCLAFLLLLVYVEAEGRLNQFIKGRIDFQQSLFFPLNMSLCPLYTFTSIINLPTPCLSVCLSVSLLVYICVCLFLVYLFSGHLCLLGFVFNWPALSK